MFGYKLPVTDVNINVFEKKIKINPQTYHAFESSFLEDFKDSYTNYPPLNDNCDPDYKKKNKVS
jgi:hypothetical protein